MGVDGEKRDLNNQSVDYKALVRAVAQFAAIDKVRNVLAQANKIERVFEDGQKANILSGACVGWASSLHNHLAGLGIKTEEVKTKKTGAHKFLRCTTNQGEMMIDPTLGQFINYPKIFIGSMVALRATFLDQKNELLVGNRLWCVDHDITTREEWFEVLYTID